MRYNIPAHCLALVLILIPANQELWCHAFLCLSTNFRWLNKDLYYHTPDRHMLFKFKKMVLKNKSFFEWSWYSWNLWFEKEGYWGGGCVRALSHFGKFQNGSSAKNVKPLTWKKLASICYVINFLGCYQFFGLLSSVGQVVILLAGYHCCNPQWYATSNIQLTKEITSFIA